MTEFDGWSAEARALVMQAIDAHGGSERWHATTTIRLSLLRAAGPLLSFKGRGQTFDLPAICDIYPHDRTTIFHAYPDQSRRGRFVNGEVAIDGVDGQFDAALRPHRASFAGLAKYRRWSSLDALYFFGYALWHYHSLPFTLPAAKLAGVLRREGRPNGVDVVFPPDVPTHCRRQQFSFGSDGRIARHDYVAEVIGSWAAAAHCWETYETIEGLATATRRRVFARIGRRQLPVILLDVTLRHIPY